MKEAWHLAASDGALSAPQIIKLYSKRWTIEPSFRDSKDLRFGMGMSALRIDDPQRRDRLLLLNAFAILLLTLLGAAGESLGMDRQLRTSTTKRRVHSLFRQGCLLYDLIPNMPDERLRPSSSDTSTSFAKALLSLTFSASFKMRGLVRLSSRRPRLVGSFCHTKACRICEKSHFRFPSRPAIAAVPAFRRNAMNGKFLCFWREGAVRDHNGIGLFWPSLAVTLPHPRSCSSLSTAAPRAAASFFATLGLARGLLCGVRGVGGEGAVLYKTLPFLIWRISTRRLFVIAWCRKILCLGDHFGKRGN